MKSSIQEIKKIKSTMSKIKSGIYIALPAIGLLCSIGGLIFILTAPIPVASFIAFPIVTFALMALCCLFEVQEEIFKLLGKENTTIGNFISKSITGMTHALTGIFLVETGILILDVMLASPAVALTPVVVVPIIATVAITLVYLFSGVSRMLKLQSKVSTQAEEISDYTSSHNNENIFTKEAINVKMNSVKSTHNDSIEKAPAHSGRLFSKNTYPRNETISNNDHVDQRVKSFALA